MQNTIYRYLPDVEHFIELVRALPEAEVEFKPSETAWSVHEIVVHLLDTEIVLQQRLKAVLAEERPPLIAFDQDAWARRLNYGQLDLEHHLQALLAMRRAFAPVLETVTEEDGQRIGVHNEDGEITARMLIDKLCITHLEAHVKQVQRNRDAFAAQKK
ncbi:DinB family protein [Paenibacillus sp. SGZ-1009]|uniref:DinB family protein n=1 Tax=Paenibacillus campi TaxID=3106031 RepID=UPI002AFE0DFA|nr:DinB family protein [Paenibacillus sp. SGZ-1009]